MIVRYNIVINEAAEEDIDVILNSLLEYTRNPIAVKNLWSDIVEAIEQISYYPYSNTIYEGKYINDDEIYRKIIIREYLIIYKVLEEEKTIHILSMVFSSSRMSYLFEDSERLG